MALLGVFLSFALDSSLLLYHFSFDSSQRALARTVWVSFLISFCFLIGGGMALGSFEQSLLFLWHTNTGNYYMREALKGAINRFYRGDVYVI